jgi:hypothetical protein
MEFISENLTISICMAGGGAKQGRPDPDFLLNNSTNNIYHILAVRLQEEHRILCLGSCLVLVIGLESGGPDVTGLQSADSDVTDIALHLTRKQERS